MGKHIPVIEEGWLYECIEGDCDHENEADCVLPVVACAGCLEALDDPSDPDGMYDIPEWPCIQSTHYGEPHTSEHKARLIAAWRANRTSEDSGPGGER